MLHYHDLGISEVFVHENFLINQIREGKHVQPEHVELLQNVIDQHFSKRKLVYISNRINSYSVDPLTYGFAGTIENLVAMAIVVSSESKRKAAQFEKDFYKKSFGIFSTLAEAVSWSYQVLGKPN